MARLVALDEASYPRREKRDAKETLGRRFETLVSAFLKDTMLDVYRTVRSNTKRPEMVLRNFQDRLERVPAWDRDELSQTFRGFRDADKATALWARLPDKRGDNLTEYLHQACVDTARCLWRRPQLVYHNVPSDAYVQNMRALDDVTCSCASRCMRGLVGSEVDSEVDSERDSERDSGVGSERDSDVDSNRDTYNDVEKPTQPAVDAGTDTVVVPQDVLDVVDVVDGDTIVRDTSPSMDEVEPGKLSRHATDLDLRDPDTDSPGVAPDTVAPDTVDTVDTVAPGTAPQDTVPLPRRSSTIPLLLRRSQRALSPPTARAHREKLARIKKHLAKKKSPARELFF
jgi:hypothetical protein